MERQYHHGDLKEALVEKGLQLLAREGYDGFSMRKLAAACGVSHTAPYKHYKSREEIIGAISQRIAVEFDAALAKAAERHPDDCRAQLMEMCAQYVRFLSANPDYFRFVFMTDHGSPIEIEEGTVASGSRLPLNRALACAERCFRPVSGDGWTRDFLAIWSMAHGLTLTLVAGTIRHGGEPGALAASLVERYMINR